jgi:CRISPR system Cascade subunit CasE
MFLSRIELDAQRRDTLRALSTPQVMHAAVESCFPLSPQGNVRKLWRVDRLGSSLFLLVLSLEAPLFPDFAAQFCPPGVSGETKAYAPLLARVAKGQVWRFRLAANPTHREKRDGDRGKVFGHVTVAYQKEWLSKKALSHGFAPDADFDVVRHERLRFRREGRFVTLDTATFEGALRVTDEDVFKDALLHGIGRAKAYGCGLLTIAAVR